MKKLQITKEDLTELYWGKGLSMKKIGKWYSVDATTIWNTMKLLGVSRRTHSEIQEQMWKNSDYSHRMTLVHSVPRPSRRRFHLSKDELYNLYWGDKLSPYQIADKLGLKERTVSRWMKQYSIQKRTPSEAKKENWKKEAFRKKTLPNLMKWNEIIHRSNLNLRSSRPTRPEKRVLNVIEANKYPFTYTGDGSFKIGALNPDFISTDGTQRLIEVFGRVFHDPSASFFSVPETSTKEGRITYFKEHGWEALVLWDDEVFNESFNLPSVIGGFLNE